MKNLDGPGQAGASIPIPPEALSAGVAALCDFQEDSGVSYPELASRVFRAIYEHPHFPLVNSLPNRVDFHADQKNETYSEAETDARREAALKRMLATPHKPHKAKEKAEPERKGQ